MKKTLIATVLMLAALASAPARAATVTVTLEIHAGNALAPPAVACDLVVSAGANGVSVLAKAKSTGCIVDYQTEQRSPYGTFVTSIDHLPGAGEIAFDVTYWSMTRNGSYTSYGVDGYRAAEGDDLGFTYTTWVNCLVPETCV